MRKKDSVKIVFLIKNNAINDPVDRLRGHDIIKELASKGWNVQYFNEQPDIDILIALDLDFKTHYFISKYPCKKLILDVQDDFINKNAAAIERTSIKKKGLVRKIFELLFSDNGVGAAFIIILYKILSRYSSRRLIKKADFIITSSYSLERILKQFNSNIKTIPDSINRKLYNALNIQPNNLKDGKTICWIGTPSNIRYLLLVNEQLGALQYKHNQVKIKLITNPKIMTEPSLKKIVDSFKFHFELVEWNENTFVGEVSRCDIGIAPLPAGIAKSSNKILTYMSCHLAVLCSGSYDYKKLYDENHKAVYYEDDHSKWYQHLEYLIQNRDVIDGYSKHGAAMAEGYYSDNIVTQYEKIFENVLDS